MTLCAFLLDGGGLKFDFTVTLGSIMAFLTFLGFLFAGIKFWGLQVASRNDLEWRVKNLETWRKEHMVEADSRDEIIRRLDRLMARVEEFIGIRDQRGMGTVRTRKDDV